MALPPNSRPYNPTGVPVPTPAPAAPTPAAAPPRPSPYGLVNEVRVPLSSQQRQPAPAQAPASPVFPRPTAQPVPQAQAPAALTPASPPRPTYQPASAPGLPRPSGPDPRLYTSPTLRSATAGQARAFDQADAEAIRAQRIAEREQFALQSAAEKGLAAQQKAEADRQKREANNAREAEFRAQGRPMYVDADGIIQPTQDDAAWQQMQASKSAESKAKADAAALADQYTREGRKFFTSKVTGQPVPLQTDEDLAKAAQARQEKARSAAYDKQLAAIEATAADPTRRPLSESARTKATEELTNTETSVRAALATRFKKAGQEVGGGADWIPFNESPTDAATAAQKKAEAITAGGEITDADLADLEADPATAAMAAKYRNLRDAVAKDGENLSWKQQQDQKAYDLKLRRDNPEEWARQQQERRSALDPAALAQDIETSAADFTTRAADHQTRAAALQKQQEGFATQLAALEAKNAQARQTGIAAGDMVQFTRADGTTEIWRKDLAAEREKIHAQAQDWQSQNQEAIDQITAESADLQTEQKALIDSQKAQQRKAKEARAADLAKMAARPATRGLAQDLAALDTEAETRRMDMDEMYPDGVPAEALAALQKDLAEKQTAALQAHHDRAQSVADAYAEINKAVVDGPNGRSLPDGTYAKTAAALAAKVGVTPAEARTMLDDQEKMDWSQSTNPDNLGNRFTGKLNEPTRSLSDGSIIINPALLPDEKAALKAIDSAPGTPEARETARKALPKLRETWATAMLPSFTTSGFLGSDFNAWREERIAKGGDFARQSPEQQLLGYLDDLQDDHAALKFARHIYTGLVAGTMDVGAQAIGLAGMAAGSVGIYELSDLAARINQDTRAVTRSADYDSAGLITRGASQAARMAPGLGLTMGAGAVVQGWTQAALATKTGFTALTGLAKGLGKAKTLDQALNQIMTGAGLAGGAAGGFVQTAGSQYAEIYGDLRARGMDHADAHRAALMPSVMAGTMTAILTVGFGATGVERLLAPAAKEQAKKTFTGFMKQVFKGAMEELPEEVFDEAFSQVTAAVAKGEPVQQALDNFMLSLPELAIGIGITGGAGAGLAELRSPSSSPDQTQPGDLAPHQRPEVIAAAEAAAANFQPAAGSTLTPANLSAALKVAQGKIGSLTTSELESLGWTRSNGKMTPAKGYQGTPALEFADKEQTKPILRQEFVDAIDQQAPEVGAAIGLDEADLRAVYAAQDGPPAPINEPINAEPQTTNATTNANPATINETTNDAPPANEPGTPANATQAPTQSPDGNGNEAQPRPQDSGSPVTLTQPAELERAEQLTNHLSMLGLPQDQAEQVAAYMVQRNGVIGDWYLDQVVDGSFPETLKELGIKGALSATKAKTNPLTAPTDLAQRMGAPPAAAAEAPANTATAPSVVVNPSNQAPSSAQAPPSLPAESHPLYTSLTRAEAYTPDEAQSLVARYLYLREKAGDKSPLEIKRFRQWIAEQETRARGGKLARSAADAEPTLDEVQDFALAHIPLADRRRARRTFRALNSSLSKWAKAIDQIDMSGAARAQLVGSIGVAMDITKDGKTVLLLDPFRLAQQVNWSALSTGIVQDAVVEEVIHATALRLSRTDKAFSTQAITAFWNDLSPKLRNTVWQSYHVIAIKNGKLPASPPANLSNDQRFQMVHEFLRMAVQNKRFQGRISETYGTNRRGVLKKIVELLEKLGSVLEDLIGRAPKQLRGRIEDYRSKIIAAIDALETGSSSTPAQTQTAPEPAIVSTRAAVTENATTTTASAAIAQAPAGDVGTAYTDTNDPIEYRWTVVEAEVPITSHTDNGEVNPPFPAQLQPRDRDSVGSEMQIQDIEGNMLLDRLSYSATVMDGAPFLGQDGVVESGNARTMAMRRAYSKGRASAAAYRSKLIARAAAFGLTSAQVSALTHPILVRIRLTEVNRVAFTRAANVGTVAPKREMEQAKIDAKQIVPDLFNAFVVSEDGDIFTKANAPFIRAFISAIVPPAEIPALIDPDGNLSQTGLRRLRNALFVYAYGDSKPALNALARLTEAINPDARNIVAGLTALAPRFASQNARIQAGVLRPLSITADIARALALYSDLKANGENVADFQQQMALPGVADAPTDLQKSIVGTLDATKRSAKRLIEVLNRYADAIETAGDLRHASLFGDEPQPTTLELWELAATPPPQALARSESQDTPTIETKNALKLYRKLKQIEREQGKLDAQQAQTLQKAEEALGQTFFSFAETTVKAAPFSLQWETTQSEPQALNQPLLFSKSSQDDLTAAKRYLYGKARDQKHLRPIVRAMAKLRLATQDSIVKSVMQAQRPRVSNSVKEEMDAASSAYDGWLRPRMEALRPQWNAYRARFTQEVRDNFDDALESIAEQTNSIPMTRVPLKGDRGMEKAILDADESGNPPDVNTINDVMRASLVALDDEGVNKVVQALKDRFKIVKIKDRFTNPLLGYHDWLIVVESQAGIRAEVQVHRADYLFAKEIGPGHLLYEDLRRLNAVRKSNASPVTDVLHRRIAKSMEAFYTSVAQAFTISRYRSSDTGSPSDIINETSATRPSGSSGSGLSPSVSQTTGRPLTSKNFAVGENVSDPFTAENSTDSDGFQGKPLFSSAGNDDLFAYNNGLSLGDLLTPAQKQVKVEQSKQLDLFGGIPNAPRPRPTAPRPSKPAASSGTKRPPVQPPNLGDLFGGGWGMGGTTGGSGDGTGSGQSGSGGGSGTNAGGGKGPGGKGSNSRPDKKPAGGSDSDLSGLSGDAQSAAAGFGPRPELGSPDRNFVIEGENIAPATDRAKIEANIAAIRLLKQLEGENRNPTTEEKAKLAAYTGWGAFKEAFNSKYEADIANIWDGKDQRYMPDWLQSWQRNHRPLHKLLKESMTEEEFASASASTLNAHYTAIPVIRAMWQMVKRMGFKGGRVLEPSAGAGHYIGAMPEDLANASRWQTVELDELSTRLLSKLYPEATVNESKPDSTRRVTGLGFERARIPNGSLDLVISNVPFHESGPRKKGFPNLNLHNFFFAHALDKVKPGGLVAFITSESTLQNNPSQRKFLASKGDLVAAIRLPNNAFKANAGTEVTTDILIFRKPDGTPFQGQAFGNLVEVGRQTITLTQGKDQTADELRAEAARTGIVVGKEYTKGGKKAIDVSAPIMVNEYFVTHPDHALGEHTLASTMYRAGGYALVAGPEVDIAQRLSLLVQAMPENVMGQQEADTRETVLADRSDKPFSFKEQDGKIYEVQADGSMEEAEWGTNPAMVKTWRSWRRVVDVIETLVEAEASNRYTDEELGRMRRELNIAYDSHIMGSGPISRHFGNRHRHLYSDPSYPLTAALENEVIKVDTKTGKKTYIYRKAEIFTERIGRPIVEPEDATDIADAIDKSLAWRGRLDASYAASLLGITPAEFTRQALTRPEVFRDPSGTLLMADEYLSGNVRAKLEQAREALENDPSYRRNVEALEKAQPERKEISRVYPNLGARWIPAPVYNAFIKEVLKGNDTVEYVPAGNSWIISGTGIYKTEDHGTERVSAARLLKHSLDMTQPMVYDGSGEDRVFNAAATQTALDALDRLNTTFIEWVKTAEVPVTHDGETKPAWEITEDAFNLTQNSFVDPKHAGDYLTFPGLNTDYVYTRAHRRSVIARFLSLRRGMMAHGVGSGKTFNQIILAQEMRRLGIAKKPMIVVQNSTLRQFAKSYLKAYPGARVLVPTKSDFQAQNRRKLVAKIATGNWDAIILPHSQFDLISNKPEAVKAYMDSQIQELMDIVNSTKDKAKVKDLEGMLKRLRDRRQAMLDALAARQDTSVMWEDLGIDALIMDEAHNYKSLPIVTRMGRVKGVPASSNSQRAINFMLKCRDIQAKTGGKNIFLATGTPIKNSMAEAFIMMQFMAPDILEEYHIHNFDDFATAYGQKVVEPEMAWGGEPKMETRFAKFQNGQSLVTMIRTMFDTAFGNEALGLDVPHLRGGEPEMVIVPATETMTQFNAWTRAVNAEWENADGKTKKENSAVPIQTMAAGIAAALDPRLISPTLPDDPASKVNNALRRVLQVYRDGQKDRTTQIIFSDLRNTFSMDYLLNFTSHPFPEYGSEGKFDLYQDIYNKLIAAGVPEKEVVLMDSSMSDVKRAAVFEKVDSGEVRIIIGSTELLGVGVNVQTRLAALHHLMPPRDFTPAMLEQRLGRMIRQGNLHAAKVEGIAAWNRVVDSINYGSEGSMDSAIYGTLARKQRFITQLLMAEDVQDSFDDPTDPVAVNMAEMAARTMGDPDFIRRIELEREIKELRLRRDGFTNDLASKKSRLQRLENWLRVAPRIEQAKADEVARLQKLWTRTAPPPEGSKEGTDISDKSVYEFGNQIVDTAAKDGAITNKLDHYLAETARILERAGKVQDTVGITINGQLIKVDVHVTLPGQPAAGSVAGKTYNGAGSLIQILRRLPDEAQRDLERHREDITTSTNSAGALREKIDSLPSEFPDQAKLDELTRERAEVEIRLRAKASPPPAATPAPADDTAGLPPLTPIDESLVTPAVRDVLDNADIIGNKLFIQDELDRKLYMSVNKALESAGGRWNKKAKAHVFSEPPHAALGLPPPLARSESDTLNESTIQSYFDLPEVNMAPEKRAPAKRALRALNTVSQKRYAQAQAFADLTAGNAAGVRTALEAQATAGVPFSTLLHDFVTHEIPRFDIRGAVIDSPRDFAAFNLAVRSPFFESLKIAVLDDRRQVIHSQIVHVGALAETIASPQSVGRIIAAARMANPKSKIAGWIIAHNHPSGVPRPSDADNRITRMMEELAQTIGVPMMDHVITNGTTYYSYREMGILREGAGNFSNRKPRLPILPTPDGPTSYYQTGRPILADWEAVASGSSPQLYSPESAMPYLKTLRTADPDHHHILYLDTQSQLRAVDRLDKSSSDTNAMIRHVIDRALTEGANHLMLGIHHGSTDASPSDSTRRLVRRLSEAASNAKITLVDAFITSADPSTRFSFAEHGMLARSESTDTLQEGQSLPDVPNWGNFQAALKGIRESTTLTPEQKKARATAATEAYHKAHPSAQSILDQRKAASAQIGRPIPPAWTSVEFFPGSTGVSVKGRDSEGRPQAFYSDAHNERALEEKFERGRQVNAALPQIWQGIQDGLARGDEEASVLRLIFFTGFRNGGEGDGRAKVKAYGASSLLSRHVSIDGDTVSFDFIGKLGVPQIHTIVNADLAADLRQRQQGKGPDDALFATNANKVRAYLQRIAAPQDIVVHDLRTWNATSLARRIIAAETAPTDPTEYWLKRDALAEVVARKLGDTRTVVLEHYIDPKVFAIWQKSANVEDGATRPRISRKDAASRGPAGQLGTDLPGYERLLQRELLPEPPTTRPAQSTAGGRQLTLFRSESNGLPTLDPRTSRPTRIFASRLSGQQGQATRDVLASRLRSALREGPLDTTAPGYPAAIAAAYGVPVLDAGQYSAITALPDVGDGAEAAVHVDDDNGVVYKVLRTGKLTPSLGIWADVVMTTELELDWHFRPADRPRHLAARLAVMMDMGGTPTEIHAVSPEGHVILKQPLSPDPKLSVLDDMQDGRLAADQPRWRSALVAANNAAGLIRIPDGLLPQYNPAAYIVGSQGHPWLVVDMKPDNYVADNQGAPRINDPVIGQITAATVAKIPGLGSVVKAALQAEQRLGDRANLLFGSASTSDANPLARLGWNHADRALSARTAAFARWMDDKTSAGETVAKWLQAENAKPFVALGKVLQREAFPATVLPREVAAKMREMNIKSAMGEQRAMDMIRALSGKPKFSDLGYPPGFAENPIARRNLYMAMTGEKPMHELPQELQDLAARLRGMLVQIGQESVRQGRMSLDTFEGLRENYMPHFYKDDADTAKNILKRFALGIKDILAQRTTAWHVVDTSVKDKDGQYRLVSYEGKKWRFKNKEHQAAWFEDFILQESLDALQGRDQRAYGKLTVADLRAPAKLAPETRGRLTEIQARLRQRYRKEAPLTIAEQEKAGLIMDPVYAIARYAAQMVHDNATAEFFNFVNSNSEWVSDNASPGFQQIPDNTRFGRLAGKYVADDLYRQITELVDTPGTALAIYDKLLSWWKTGKTVLNPGTHVRNLLGNLAFSQFAGASVWNPGNWSYYRDSIRHLRNGGAMLTEAYDQGVLGGDYVSAELRQSLRTLLPDDATIQDDESARSIMTGLGKAMGQVLPQWAKNPVSKGYDKIAALYQAEDEVYKLAAYLKAKAMGLSPQEAAEHVRKWFPFYDGAGTSGTIKLLGRTAMPFLSFYRESIRIFGSALKERPLALATSLSVPSLITFLSAMLLGLDDDDLEQIKKDMRGKAGKLLGPTPLGGLPIFSMLLPMRSGSGQLQQLDLSAVHPFVDFLGNRVETDKTEDWWQQTWRSILTAGPIGNLLYAQMTGRDAFGDRPFVEPNMTGGEKLAARVDNALKTALPPLTPFVGTGWTTVANAGTRSTNKTLEMRDPTQAVLRAVGGIDVRNANPDIYRIADDFRKANGLPTSEGMDFSGTTPASRARKALFGLLAQDNPNPTAVKNVLAALDTMGNPIRTQKDIDTLLRYKNPLYVINGRDNQQRFRASLQGPEREVLESALAEYERIKARAPMVIATAAATAP